MALVIKDRVKETSSTSGIGEITLLGAVTGFQSFSVIGNGNSTYYCIVDQNGPNWEVGIGTWNSTGKLTRNSVLSNSAGTTNFINFTTDIKDVFCTYPSEKAIMGATSAINSTGTGDVVLSNAPVILNPDLTGNISANVNLRSGTLTQLLQIPGGTSEVGYATDTQTLVLFNGVQGGAKVYSSYSNGTTLNYLVNDANVNNVIDCAGISYLNLTFDQAMITTVGSLNIKLPAQAGVSGIQELKINMGVNLNINDGITFNLTYQPADIAVGSNYYLPLANDPATANTAFIPFLALTSDVYPYAINFSFVAASTNVGWTRLPIIGEAATLYTPRPSYVGGATSIAGSSEISLSSSATLPTTLVTYTIPRGTWIIYGGISFTSTNATALVATELVGTSASLTPTVSASTSFGRGDTFTPSGGLANTKIISITLPTIIVSNNATTPQTRYFTARAVFSQGTVTARAYGNLVRLA